MNKKLKRSLIGLIFIALLVWLDQWTKSLVVANFQLGEALPLIEGVFQIHYIENIGMAWSMLEGKQVLFAILTPIVIFFLAKGFVCVPDDKKFAPIRIVCVALIAGAIGNFIDRVWGGEELFTGGVIDFFDFCLINFPIFNVADIYVTCSVVALFILLIKVYKDEDFEIIINSCLKFKKGDKKDEV